MKRQTIIDRFSFFAVSALSLTLLFVFACSSESEPATEVIHDDNVVVTTAAEAAVSSDAPETTEDYTDSDATAVEVVDEEPETPADDSVTTASNNGQEAVSQVVEMPKTRQLPDAVPEDVAVIWEAFQFINDEYVDYSLVDPTKMSEEAIRGFIEALGDPHMTYISPEQMRMSRDDLAGEFFGIGATVAQAPDGKGVIIQAPMENSPAMKAGIKPGDRILAVDGVDATGWSVSEAVLIIRGEEGVPVILTILHVGDVDPVDIEVIRGRVKLESVYSRMIPDTSYGEMDIRQFTDETPGEIREHMNDLISQGAEGVVIDLRPGMNSIQSSLAKLVESGAVAVASSESSRKSAEKSRPSSQTVTLSRMNLPIGYPSYQVLRS